MPKIQRHLRVLKNLEEVAYAILPAARGEMRCFHAAAIFKKRKIITIGFNKKQSHPNNLNYNYLPNAGICAEMRTCLKGGREDYSGFSIAVLRIDRNNKLNYSKPCRGCSELIKKLNFKNIYHTNHNGEWE